MQRRDLLRAAPALLAAPARAQGNGVTFDRTLRIVVPNAPGGTSDILARLLAVPFGQALGQTVAVENRAGAAGMIGADVVAKSAPDGHTMLLLDVSALATAPHLFSRLSFDPKRDLSPVTMVIYAPYILAVAPQLPVTNGAELAAYVKANRDKVNFANAGSGAAAHLTSLILADHWGVEMTHVPYRGGAAALTAVAQNEAQLLVNGATATQAFVTDGRLKGIAVSGPKRLAALPDLPTFAELGWPAAEAGTWQGLLVAGRTPAPIVARLEAEVRAAFAQPALRERIGGIGGELRLDGPAAFATWLDAETESYGRVIRQHGVRAE